MATFNRAHLIEETLVSIQNQTYHNWECLIIDDGCSDATQAALEPYLKKDPRFQYYKRPDKYKKGLPGCRNYGLDIAKVKYVIFFDDDDIVHPELLEIAIDSMQTNPNAKFFHYQKKSFSETFQHTLIQPIKTVDTVWMADTLLYEVVTQKTPFASCTVLWDRNCFDTVRFNEDLQYAEEWECYTRILSTGTKGLITNTVLYFNRKHPQSNTGEFWKKDPVRRASRVEASRLVLQHLADNKLFTYRLGVYFVSLAHFLKNKQIFNYVMAHKQAFNTFEYLKLIVRYKAHGLIRPVYKLKKRIA